MAKKKRPKKPKLTVAQVVKATGHKTDEWIGNCYYMSVQVVEAGLIKGRAVYGHYLGFVHPDAPTFGRRSDIGWQRHGWIITDDGYIVDVTRWVFENKKPSIYIDKLGGEYDEGGTQLRKAMFRPCPEYNPDTAVDLPLSDDATREYLMLMGNPKKYWCREQIAWIANLPYDMHDNVEYIYTALSQNSMKAFIPFDYQRMCEDEHAVDLTKEAK